MEYLAPEFEKGAQLDFMIVDGHINCWQEHENPYKLFSSVIVEKGIPEGQVFLDESTPYFVSNGIRTTNSNLGLIDVKPMTAGCRMIKSQSEIDLIQQAMDITMEVQRAIARILRMGFSAKEVTNFMNEAHIRYGIPSGSYFCIVLFGKDSSFPHGVKAPKNLEAGEVILIDTGCMLHDYISDIARTYVFGEPTSLQGCIWNIEREAQQAAFKAAKLGASCVSMDMAAGGVMEANGLGPDYGLPGLSHRTGHGIGYT